MILAPDYSTAVKVAAEKGLIAFPNGRTGPAKDPRKRRRAAYFRDYRARKGDAYRAYKRDWQRNWRAAHREAWNQYQTKCYHRRKARKEQHRSWRNRRYPERQPQPGEISMKRWAQIEAIRLKLTPHAIHVRFSRGQYPDLHRRIVNKRVIFVRPSAIGHQLSAMPPSERSSHDR